MEGDFLDEEDLLERIGWVDEERGLSVGLGLNERDLEGEDWKMELFLGDKKNSDVEFFEGIR
ncbi:hypothetical protein [Bacillus pumilus]|uniref:hypothetical protein n=1 Tax=Bacillus pumilus TaxID=1408 RepID=UPI0011AAA816|nr:hypothetical protein [Bacillus pumilus]